MFIFYARSIWPFCTSWQALFLRFRVLLRSRAFLAIAVSWPRVFLFLPFGLTHSRDTYHWYQQLADVLLCTMLSSGVLSVAQYPLLEALLSTAWAHVRCHVRYGTPFLCRPPTVDLSSFPLGSGLAFVFLFQGYTAVPGQYLFRVGLAFSLITSR